MDLRSGCMGGLREGQRQEYIFKTRGETGAKKF